MTPEILLNVGPVVAALLWLLYAVRRLHDHVGETRSELLRFADRLQRLESTPEVRAGLRAVGHRARRRNAEALAALRDLDRLGIGMGIDPATVEPREDDPLLRAFRDLEREVRQRECEHARSVTLVGPYVRTRCRDCGLEVDGVHLPGRPR